MRFLRLVCCLMWLLWQILKLKMSKPENKLDFTLLNHIDCYWVYKCLACCPISFNCYDSILKVSTIWASVKGMACSKWDIKGGRWYKTKVNSWQTNKWLRAHWIGTRKVSPWFDLDILNEQPSWGSKFWPRTRQKWLRVCCTLSTLDPPKHHINIGNLIKRLKLSSW